QLFTPECCVTLLLSVAWADHHEGHHHGHSATGEAHSHEGEDICHKISPPNADFAFALYKNLNAKTAAGKNIFYSPLGIATVLSMLSLGAHGATHSEMFTTLGYSPLSMTQDQVNEAYKHLLHMLGHSQEAQQLEVGNALVLRTGFNPVEKFMKDLKDYYSGETFDVDFNTPDTAVTKINSFIAKKTHDKIDNMLSSLDPDTAMVLINYVFFRGKWEKPFDAEQTHKADFHVDDATTVQVDMMKRTGRYDFYQDQDNHTTVIMLPYKSNTSMMIVLPDEGKMAEVEGYINKDYIRHCSVELYLPKFSISADASLADTLKEMGIVSAFGDTADFSGISEEVKLKVSKVSHKAVLSVDETGTEAASATTAEIMPMSLPDNMKLDRPFLVFILEHSTKSVLFMGKINNPTAE
uniref:Serpin peptidase inhibitor, clade A (alpha-1 antiproteinase, antitrypsin), member 1 n=1 Tax=Myripristis murdjan TaxID=586833 RepID=A0A667Y536_9TELE